jgi:Dienelactone hydrolase family
MNRREFIGCSTTATLGFGFGKKSLTQVPQDPIGSGQSADTATLRPSFAVLPGTESLRTEGDLAAQMVKGIQRYLLHKTDLQTTERERLWHRDYTSIDAYESSVEPNRQSLRQMIGAVDTRTTSPRLEVVSRISTSLALAQGGNYTIYAVRWSVFPPSTSDSRGLEVEGLLLEPDKPLARVVAIPDADWTPEMLVGLAPGLTPQEQFARRLAENGCQVIVPVLINRDDTFSGIPGVGMTNMPHREWIYRMAYEVGRHIIGFEVQEVLAAVDWFTSENAKQSLPIGVIGYGEGGLIALYSAATDTRITATMISGCFQARDVWKEPIYRDVWGLVGEFGDAELASLIAPRALVVEACQAPRVSGPPPAKGGAWTTLALTAD